MGAPIILYIDTTNRRLVSSFLSSVPPFQGITLEAGDSVPVELHFLTVNPSSGTAGALTYSYIDPATLTPVTLGIGTIGSVPTAGTFTVTYGANTTAALAYNITASALSTAINALASVISAGGVTIVGSAGGPWTITFVTPGVISTLFAVNATLLNPTSLGLTSVVVTGTVAVPEVQAITLIQSPAASQVTWTTVYPEIVITRVQAGGSGVNEIQSVAVPQGTYAGTFTVSFGGQTSNPIAYNATSTVVQAALQAMTSIGSNNVSVSQTSTTAWAVTFVGALAGAGQTLMTGSATGLGAPEYLSGTVNLNVQGIFNLLIGKTSAAPTLQIQQGTSGNINTVLQTGITLNSTLIRGTPSDPNPSDPWQTLSQVEALIAGTVATTTTAGTVIVPTAGHLSVDGSGNITVSLASSSVFGVVKVDGVTLQAATGVLSTVDTSVRVTTPFAVTSSATLVNVTGLTVNVAGSGKYLFEALLYTTATSGGGIQAAIAGTATATSVIYEGELISGGALVAQTRASSLGTAVGSLGTATAGTIWITGEIVVNAGGTLTVQFAQNTSNGSASTVLTGSWFRVWPSSN